MEHNKSSRKSGRRLWCLVLGSALLLLVVVVLIVPGQRSLAKLEKDIDLLSTRLAAQKILFPLYQKLTDELQAEEAPARPLPERAELKRDQVAEVPTILAEIARRTDLQAVGVTPDLASLTGDAGFFKVDAVLQGDFFDFRNFLTALGEAPYLHRIEEIQVQAQPASKEYRLKLWLALRK